MTEAKFEKIEEKCNICFQPFKKAVSGEWINHKHQLCPVDPAELSQCDSCQ